MSTNCIPFFTSLETSCPELQDLQLGDKFSFHFAQQLALVLGKRSQLLSQSSIAQKMLQLGIDETNLQLLQFFEEHTTPICQSLKDLAVFVDCKKRHLLDDEYDEDDEDLLIASRAFLLRHFPNLDYFRLKVIRNDIFTDHLNCRLIELLHDESQLESGNSTKAEIDGQILTENGDILQGLKWKLKNPLLCKFPM